VSDTPDYRYDKRDGVYHVLYRISTETIVHDDPPLTVTAVVHVDHEIGDAVTIAEAMHLADLHMAGHR